MSSTPSSSVPLRYPSLLHWAVAILNTHDSTEKSTLTLEAYFLYNKGELPLFACDDSLDEAFPQVPEKPARPLHLTTLPPKDMPPAKKGIENHEWNKLRLIHSLAHIESYAIDLSLDILVRFATRKDVGRESTEGVPMPEAFYRDWLRIAAEEAKHFSIWNTRLIELGSSYGSMPVHDGLWQSAEETAHSLLARLAVVHAVHEARGLDSAPRMLGQFGSYGDKKSAKLLETIEVDELTHVTSGLNWFKYICQKSSTPVDPIPRFHEIVRKNFRGNLLPPFNVEARTKCGFTPEWYEPLAQPKKQQKNETPKEIEKENKSQFSIEHSTQSEATNCEKDENEEEEED